MQSYQGVALVCPVSLGYVKQSHHSAAWFIGSVLREMLNLSGLEKRAVDGLAPGVSLWSPTLRLH